MAAGAESIQGPRLEFVVRKLSGTVTRFKYKAPPTREDREEFPKLNKNLMNVQQEYEAEAGYMIFFPTGNCYRLSNEELIKRNFEREPNIIGFEQANDTKSAAGRFKLARSESARKKAWEEMEKQIIDACVGRYGKIEALISDYNPKGKMVLEEAA